MSKAAFAIPGDKDRRTGGFLYEATVLRTLNEIGCATQHLQLPAGFPAPTLAEMSDAIDQLRAVPADRPIILDGLVFGAIDPEGLATVPAPVIAMIHHPLGLETGLEPARAEFLRRNEAEALRHAAHVIVPSPETKRLLVAEFGANPARITLAPPGFTQPSGARRPAAQPLILSVGLIAPRKGHDILMQALARIADLDWTARIIGKDHDPVHARALLDLRARLHLEDRVTFEGELSGASLDAAYRSASVFALPTRYEGYGMVLSEAMTYGLPVISCAVGAVPDTLGSAGIIVPPEDPSRFAAALRTVLEDSSAAEFQSRQSLLRAQDLPDWQDTARIFADVIHALSAR